MLEPMPAGMEPPISITAGLWFELELELGFCMS
jgi:hypothetical protein